MKYVFLSIIISFYLGLFVPKTSAASFDLSVSPPIFQIELTPPANAAVSKQITLENASDDAMELEIIYRHFKPFNENGIVEYLPETEKPGNDPDIFNKVLVLDEGKPISSIVIPPKSKKQLDLRISIPKDSPPSDYYFSILFISDLTSITADGEQTDAPSSSTALGGVGVNVLLSVGPKGTSAGTIDEFSTPLFQNSGPVPFMVRVKNNSGHFIAPKASIEIKNMFGQRIGMVDLLPVNILSNTTRSLPSREQFLFESERQSGKVDEKTLKKIEEFNTTYNKDGALSAIWPEKFLFGPYTANLTVALSDEGPIIRRSIVFIGFPTTIFIGLFVAVALLLLIRSRLKHRESK